MKEWEEAKLEKEGRENAERGGRRWGKGEEEKAEKGGKG
jgi:hypothetical protein